ncbi:MAG: AAC(3) family N-acetyltransferase, partial [Theionarchaea archaeon]|nr:AAC(3) family N-acetyltransferase [Theionarchaea archaeon]
MSLKSIGWIKGGPNTLIDALLEAVGEEGTIFIPAFTRYFPLPLSKSTRGDGIRPRWEGIIPWEFVFDPIKTPPETGSVPVAMWKRSDSLRSRHPTNSVVAIGRLARYLTEGHDHNTSAFLPYERLVNIGGRGLFIGLDGRLVSLRHQGQYQAGLMHILPPLWGVRFLKEDGSIGVYARREWGCTKRLPELNEEMVREGLIMEGMIGNAESMLVDAAGVVETIANRLKEDPSINLCRRFLCLWCRELERKYDLYPKIQDPSIFQSSGAIRKV